MRFGDFHRDTVFIVAGVTLSRSLFMCSSASLIQKPNEGMAVGLFL